MRGLLIILVVIIVPFLSYAQHDHAQHHDWYRSLRQPQTNISCCNGTVDGAEGDCRPVRAYQRDDGQWMAFVEGGWVLVPNEVILPRGLSQEPFQKHICKYPGGPIRCFLRDEPGG